MGLGTAFLRLSAHELAAVAPALETGLKADAHAEVVTLLRGRAEHEFQGWDSGCWRLPGTLELLSFHYGNDLTLLGFLRADRTRAEWQAHLSRLPDGLAAVALCDEVTLLAPEERRALRQAWDDAEADRWARIQSDRFALSPEELPFLLE